MAVQKTAWGIEIGAAAIKAIRLERDGDDVQVSDFCVIPQKKVLTTPDLDQDEMIRLGLGQFISEKSLEGEHLVMSVPGHSAFARFAKLPPVEPKKVPDIVKFEAVQQIPFPIDEVEWDYQTFSSEDSPETEVGIFAITRERVQGRLNLYGELGLSPEALTLSPVAVYNAMAFDMSLVERGKPVMFLDVGTQATDVIIAEDGRCWIRTFPLGGTHFTEAIASSFKLSYSKAEKLKLEAGTSKYAKQIMQAMRPVFSDLLQDLQRSIGYYASLHREAELNTIVGIGSTFKIPGLRKFLGQQLQVNVHRLDEFKRIQVTGREAASFAEHTVNMATAYGLALQGVGLATIDANLVPVKTLREQMWHQKTKWFAAAAAIAVVGAGIAIMRPLMAGQVMSPAEPLEITQVLQSGNNFKQQFEQLERESDMGALRQNMLQLLDYRRVWPHLAIDAAEALGAANPQPALLSDDLEEAAQIPAVQRRLIRLGRLTGDYEYNAESGAQRIRVTMEVELSRESPVAFLNQTVGAWLREAAEQDRPDAPYRILADSISMNPEQQLVFRVSDDGSVTSSGSMARSGTAAGGDGGSGAPGTGSSRPATGGTAIGPGAGQPSTPSGPGAGMGQAGPGRRETTGDPIDPNIGIGTAGGAGAGGFTDPGAAAGTTGTRPSGGFDFTRPGSRGQDRGLGDIENLAPIPGKPRMYKAGDSYYRYPITFTIELRDPSKPESGTDPSLQAGLGGVGGAM